MDADRIESAVAVLATAVRELDGDRMDTVSAHRLHELFSRGERACAGAAAVLARRIGDPRTLARQQGTTLGKARAMLGLSDRLADTPALESAVRAGGLSMDQATEIAKAETAAPGCADDLVDVARSEPFHELRHRARQAVLANGRESLGTRQRAARRGGHHITDMGLVHVEADLEPHVGAPIVDRLEAEARKLAAADGRKEPFAAYVADAFSALFDRRASGRAGKPEVVVVVSHEVVARGWTAVEAGEVCRIPGFGPIDPDTARGIADDAFITGVISDGKDLRQMRRWTRHIPVEIKLALNLGAPPKFDGRRCVDCGNRYRLEHDHALPISENGPTSLDNLPDRCHSCHAAKTRADEARRRARRRASGPGATEGRAPPLAS